MKNKITLSSVMMSAMLLSGCASNEPLPEAPKVINSRALDALASIAVETRDEMRLLAKSQDSIAQAKLTKEQHEQRYINATLVPDGFEVITERFDAVGPASDVAEKLAAVAGYEFKETTRPSSVEEPWVNIRIRNQPLNDALYEIGIQTGDVVSVQAYGAAKLMLFRYTVK
ncbi:DotD/TraH family lipoprotein [Vibrio splendidus]